MRTLTTFLLLVLLGLPAAQAQEAGVVRINEVGYEGVDFEGAARWVELVNTGADEVDVSSYWLCNFPAYQQLSDLTVLAGATTIPAGGYLVVAFDDLGMGDGEVGLYASQDFGSADAMLDYLQYGSAGHQREGVAVEAGLWEADAFVAAAMSGEALAFVGGTTSAARWRAQAPTAGMANGADPETAPRADIDRFSDAAGTLFVRDGNNGLPAAGAPIDFDQAPFITQGYGPAGDIVRYYNFDVQPVAPAPIYVLFREGEEGPVGGQLNLVDVIPGDEGYNDFWQVTRVTVPPSYVANTITSVAALMEAAYPMETLDVLVNCPIVPEGSTALLRLNEGNTTELVRGWYEDQVVHYFEFGEAALQATGGGEVPVSPIFVTFNVNPGEPGGGPPSGFMTEAESAQTHNVLATLPGDEAYSPLWQVNIYDNAAFESVGDLASAQAAPLLVPGAALVNCPVVAIEPGTAVEVLDEQPSGFVLHGNYPNPFNPETTIRYELDAPGRVSLAVYNLLGQRVVQLVDSPQAAGVYQATWDGRDADGRLVATGTYLYRLVLDGRSEVRTMVLLK